MDVKPKFFVLLCLEFGFKLLYFKYLERISLYVVFMTVAAMQKLQICNGLTDCLFADMIRIVMKHLSVNLLGTYLLVLLARLFVS